MSKMIKIKESYQSKDLSRERKALIYGDISSLNQKILTKGSMFIFRNFWIQIKGLFMLFGNKKYILDASTKSILLNRITSKGEVIADKSMQLTWKNIKDIKIKRVTIGRDHELYIYTKQGVKITLEFNQKYQENDLKTLNEMVSKQLNIIL